MVLFQIIMIFLITLNSIFDSFQLKKSYNPLNTRLFCKNVPKDKCTTVANLFQTHIVKIQRFNSIVPGTISAVLLV